MIFGGIYMENKITENTSKDFDAAIKNADLNSIYKSRREKISAYLQEKKIGAAVFIDSEDRREPALRYLTGHPTDAVLVICDNGKSVLSPWDENLAAQKAYADEVIPFTSFQRDSVIAVKEILEKSSCAQKTLAISPATTFIDHRKFSEAMEGWQIECKEDSVHEYTGQMRAQKDEYEIACTRKACAITSAMTDIIERKLISGEFATEADVALFIERELRIQGCERTSFDTLAAGPGRSFAIHAFPGYTGGAWGSKGLSILDYGVCYEGYASDCTITVARGPLCKEQTEILDLVQKAADECINLYKPGMKIHDASQHCDDIFAEAGKSMPHSLGHGTGLEIHEAPFISMRTSEDKLFMPGNIVTLEPGLYDSRLGGCRLENDVLITESGNVVLTNSRIIRL